MTIKEGCEAGSGTIRCDYCEATAPEEQVRKGEIQGWDYAHRGIIVPMKPDVCMLSREVKHACGKKLCKANLLIWSRS